MATTLLRHRIVEDFTDDKGLKLGLVSGQIGLVLAGVIAKLQPVFAGAAKAIREALRPRPCSIVGGLATDMLRSRAELVVVFASDFSAASGATVSTTLLLSANGTSVRCSRSIAFGISTSHGRTREFGSEFR